MKRQQTLNKIVGKNFATNLGATVPHFASPQHPSLSNKIERRLTLIRDHSLYTR
jgi:hypothetical protein